jgi:CheY-like chemotaxis protein
LSRHILESSGYTVLEASHGDEALEICATHSDPIHMLITDVVMPEMSGPQVAEQMLKRRPELKVLYLSGYTDDAVVRHGVLKGQAPFLQKPFSAGTLSQKVREVLDAKPSLSEIAVPAMDTLAR